MFAKGYRTPLGIRLRNFLGGDLQVFGSGIGGGEPMKFYPMVEELLASVLRLAMLRPEPRPAHLNP